MSSENDTLRYRIHKLEADNAKLRMNVAALTLLLERLSGRVAALEAPHADTMRVRYEHLREHLRREAFARIVSAEPISEIRADYEPLEPLNLAEGDNK